MKNRTFNYFFINFSLAWFSLVSICLAESKTESDQSKKDDHYHMEIPGVTIKRDNISNYKTLKDVPPIKYITPNIPQAKAPLIEGKYYEVEVPDTCDLAENARLVVNTTTQLSCPQAEYEVYVYPQFQLDPARVYLGSGSGLCWPKVMEYTPLMRMMSGSTQGLEVDKEWAKIILHSLGSDGLWYLNLPGRPWNQVGFTVADQVLESKADWYAYMPTMGRMLGTLALYYKITGDEVWNSAAKKMVDAMDRLAAREDGKAYYKNSSYFPNGQPAIGGEDTNSQQNYGWNGVGLCQYYRVSNYKPALDLAKAIIKGYCHHFQPDGSYDLSQFHHVYTLFIHALAEYAYTAKDKEIGTLAKNAYEYSKFEDTIPSLGFFPCAPLAMEPCALADMIAIAVKLTQAGIADYWDDVDKYVRNGLIESQFTKPEEISNFIQMIKEGKAVANPSWTPSGVEAKPLAYNESADRIPERLVGFFSTGTLPNDKHLYDWDDICCTGNCARALYYAWENILTHEQDTLSVNLLLNRVSEWADVESYIPYKGQVDIKIKKPCNLKVRVNDWVDKSKVKCSVNQNKKTLQWDGNYIVLGAVKPDQLVRVEFPISERTEKVTTAGHTYTVVFRGNDAVDITPKGPHAPIYQRSHYRQEKPHYIKKNLFIPTKTIEW